MLFNGEVIDSMLTTGAFLSAGERANVMTISWGGIGFLWKKKIAFVPVRRSRYSKEFIDKNGCFALSVPINKMSAELKYCGSHSGRDTDKIKSAGLTMLQCEHISTQKVAGCDEYYECKVLTSVELTLEMLPEELQKMYATGDVHTLYIAEILN